MGVAYIHFQRSIASLFNDDRTTDLSIPVKRVCQVLPPIGSLDMAEKNQKCDHTQATPTL